ncbi:MAG: DUF1207 domain-containing protein [Melioribacter sp.]|nr:DUF1207 domain-containing protein [Melioribacter sp.]
MKKTILLFFFITISTLSQNLDLFPGSLNIQPFIANTLEPKLGFLFQLSKNELRLDIGNSLDIFHYSKNESEVFSFGADLFTYTLLRGEKDFHFPVDAVDYLFGINGSYKKVEDQYEYGTRVRISHISAHFVDGHYDASKGEWRDGLNPRVYSREFIELIPFVKFNSLRVYAGITYLFHVTPDYLGKDIYQLGFDYVGNQFDSETLSPFLAYDFKLVNLSKYSANHSFSAGIKFGKPDGRGFSIYFNYYSGKSIHGEYFDFTKTYSAIGINLDL